MSNKDNNIWSINDFYKNRFEESNTNNAKVTDAKPIKRQPIELSK